MGCFMFFIDRIYIITVIISLKIIFALHMQQQNTGITCMIILHKSSFKLSNIEVNVS